MDVNSLDQFGEEFIKQVRDRSFRKYLKTKAGEMKSPTDIRLYEQLKSLTEEQLHIVDSVVFDALEYMLHQSLFMFEESEIWTIADKNELEDAGIDNLVNSSDGLSGELYSEEGWIAKYSEFPYEE